MPPIPRLRDYTGPGLISYGFRPFFLLASRYAGLSMLAWLPMFYGELELSTAFAPLGYLLVGLATFGTMPSAAGVHAWTGGAMGVMTLAVMSRASLGHTGRALVASRAIQGIYLLAVAAVLARVGAAIASQRNDTLLRMAGGAWVGAFLGFSIADWQVFTRPRRTA